MTHTVVFNNITTQNLQPPITLDYRRTYTLSLLKGEFVYSWDTISAALGNNGYRWRADPADPWIDATVPDGCFSLHNLETYLRTVLGEANISLLESSWHGRARVRVANGHEIELGTLGAALGFAPGTAVTGEAEGSAPVDLTGGVTAVNLTCPILVSGSTSHHPAGNAGGGVIATLSLPNSAPYGVCDLVSNGVSAALGMESMQSITKIRLELLDQELRKIKLRSGIATYWLKISDAGVSAAGARKATN